MTGTLGRKAGIWEGSWEHAGEGDGDQEASPEKRAF